jgi:serine/threonine protein kinase
MIRSNAASARFQNRSSASRGAARYSGVDAIEGPPVGTVIDGVYTLRSILGHGEMGVVFLARDEVLERDVAIKFVRADLVAGASLRERFLTEARAMARVNHPNVVHVYALGEYESAPYLVMELVEGQSLERWADSQRENGGLPDIDFALAMLEQACLGVQAIHDARTVHRDLKPGNILLDGQLRARIADLGLANLIRTGGGPRTGEIVGTPFYIAPEIALGDEIAVELMARADVYSLGCMAYELLTGKVPFDGPTVLATLLHHITTAPVPPSRQRPELGDRYDEVILRALAKKPHERTPTAEAFRRELIAARNDTREPVRILVADDDEDFRCLLVELLNREFPFAEIEAVRNGVEAIEAFDARHHSVAVVDLNMPTLGGLELTGLLRARDSAMRVPIIVLTGEGGAHEWQRLWAVGADGFLVKPVNPSDVVTLVRRALGERSRSMPPEAERV